MNGVEWQHIRWRAERTLTREQRWQLARARAERALGRRYNKQPQPRDEPAATKRAPSPSESDAELYARFQAASENTKEWPGLRSEYNKANGANEMLGAPIKMQVEEGKTPAARGKKTKVSNPVRVYATQFWLNRDERGHGAMLPEHEAKFGKAPILAETPDGRLHVLDGHHTLFHYLREGGGAVRAFVFEIATPNSQDGKALKLIPLFARGELARRLATALREKGN